MGGGGGSNTDQKLFSNFSKNIAALPVFDAEAKNRFGTDGNCDLKVTPKRFSQITNVGQELSSKIPPKIGPLNQTLMKLNFEY